MKYLHMKAVAKSIAAIRKIYASKFRGYPSGVIILNEALDNLSTLIATSIKIKHPDFYKSGFLRDCGVDKYKHAKN